MKRVLTSFALIALIAKAPIALAQDPSKVNSGRAASPESELIIDSIGQTFNQMFGGFVSGAIEYLSKPETAAKIAAMYKGYIDALMKEGFSRQEAMNIMTSSAFPTFSSE
jgi:hypothetical protein